MLGKRDHSDQNFYSGGSEASLFTHVLFIIHGLRHVVPGPGSVPGHDKDGWLHILEGYRVMLVIL